MDSNKFIVRRTKKDDLGAIVEMIQELADFEEMPNGPTLKVEDLIRDGNFDSIPGNSALFYSFVAECNGKPVGYSIAFHSYSTWEGKSLLLEDIYIKPECRQHGFGKSLFLENVKLAKATNCSRFDFHVLNWNPAKKFYQKLGATNLTEKEGWELFRLTKEQINSLSK